MRGQTFFVSDQPFRRFRAAREVLEPAMSDWLISITMVAALMLGGIGGWYVATGRARKQGLLMLVLAALLVANAALWSLPPPTGAAR